MAPGSFRAAASRSATLPIPLAAFTSSTLGDRPISITGAKAALPA